jgi:hypothetical protein
MSLEEEAMDRRAFLGAMAAGATATALKATAAATERPLWRLPPAVDEFERQPAQHRPARDRPPDSAGTRMEFADLVQRAPTAAPATWSRHQGSSGSARTPHQGRTGKDIVVLDRWAEDRTEGAVSSLARSRPVSVL